jgi:alpha-L-arabinofuranosidase
VLVRDNRMPIITSANGLQPDGQNDNGWDQGLLFLNPSQVWFQPAGYVTQMQAKNDLPVLLKCDTDSSDAAHLDVTATRSEDGKTLVVQIINLKDAESVQVDLGGFVPSKSTAHVTELTGPLDAVNTAEKPTNIVPKETDWAIERLAGKVQRDLPAHSFTILRFE